MKYHFFKSNFSLDKFSICLSNYFEIWSYLFKLNIRAGIISDCLVFNIFKSAGKILRVNLARNNIKKRLAINFDKSRVCPDIGTVISAIHSVGHINNVRSEIEKLYSSSWDLSRVILKENILNEVRTKGLRTLKINCSSFACRTIDEFRINHCQVWI